MTRSCVVLFSGGLDSTLAVRLMAVQGLRVIAMNSVNCFHGTAAIEDKKRALRDRALALGAADMVFPDMTEEVIAVTKSPRHGYGRHLNACIDCRLRTVARGFRLMRERQADFVVSGEVIGQRPMSQRKNAIELADRLVAKWGFAGLLLRPLSARVLPETVPQREGWVSPQYLYDISGRGRDRQIALAAELGITSYPTPAGGCLLTDPEYGRRLAVLMRYNPEWGSADAELLKVGRHFQIAPDIRLVASRREEENYRLRELAAADDLLYINDERNGAMVLLRGAQTPTAEAVAAGPAVFYSKGRENGAARVCRWRVAGEDVDHHYFLAAVTHPDRAREMEAALTGGNSLKILRAGGAGFRPDAASPF